MFYIVLSGFVCMQKPSPQWLCVHAKPSPQWLCVHAKPSSCFMFYCHVLKTMLYICMFSFILYGKRYSSARSTFIEPYANDTWNSTASGARRARMKTTLKFSTPLIR